MSPKPTESTKIPATRRGVNSSTNLALVYNLAPKDDFAPLISEWLLACKANNLSHRTVTGYEQNVNKFLWWWREHTHYAEKLGSHPSAVTVRHIREYVIYLRTPSAFRWGEEVKNGKHELSRVSVISYARDLKVFFNWLEKEEYLERTPFNHSIKLEQKASEKPPIKV